MIPTGKSLLHYRIVEKIGEGGMGAVYKAHDSHLDRFVALKVLPPEKVGDPERRHRFVQEAKAASALNHPNIVHIYDIFTAEGFDVIAMEYVPGRTLDEAVGAKGLKLSQALGYAIQIADALAKAHAAYIVHRDLKPSNVMVTPEGSVRLLDFGLAKLTEPRGPGATIDSSVPTRGARALTEEGVVVGTAAYMSPEQAQGLEVDARSDIFSFGAVLYEMLTGRRAFPGESIAATLAAILTAEPRPPSQVAGPLPPELDSVLIRCLRKEPGRRWQSMADLKVMLEDLKEESNSGRLSGVTPAPRGARRTRFLTPLALVALVAVAGAILWLLPRQIPSPPTLEAVRFTTDPGLTFSPALTADGKLAAFASDRSGEGHLDIWVQQAEGREPIRRTFHEADEVSPSFSPDGSKIVFRSDRDGGGVYITDTLGGEERRLVDGGEHPRFSPDGSLIAYVQLIPGTYYSFKMHILLPQGGTPRAFQPEFTMAPSMLSSGALWSPDGRYILFPGYRDSDRSSYDWWAAPVDGGPPTSTGAVHYFDTPIRVAGAWTGDHVIFSQGGLADGVNLFSLPLARDRVASSPPTRLSSGVGLQLDLAVADDGRMLFSDINLRVNFFRAGLDPATGRSTGDLQPVTTDSTVKLYPMLSSDGSQLVFQANASLRGRRVEVRRLDLVTGREATVYSSDNLMTFPCVSPDGSLVAYHDEVAGKTRAYVIGRDQAAGTEVCASCRLFGFSSGSERALIRCGENRIVLQDIATGSQTEVLTWSSGVITDASFSPDNGRLAFLAATPGRGATIYVTPAEAAVPEEQRTAIAADGSYLGSPLWSADGSVVYFLSEWDGHPCIWGRRVDPASGRPEGDPFGVLHLHGGRRRGLRTAHRTGWRFTVARDNLIFPIWDATANLWITRLPETER